MHAELCPDSRRRNVAAAAIAWLAVCPFTDAALAQGRTACIGGVPGAPSVFIDSAASEVTVVTTDGARLSASRNLLLCPGDEVQTGTTGRVAIRFDEKRTVVRLDGNSRTRILSGGTGDADVSLLSGLLYFVSSVRRHFEVDTPYIVAGIDGTEAIVGVRPADSLAITVVREGIVSAYDHQRGQASTLRIAGGEAAFRSAGVPFQSAPIGSLPPPFRELLIASDSAVDWAVYYPPILFARGADSSAVRSAITFLASGDYDLAAAALDAAHNATPAETAALRSIIAISRNRISEAQHWSELALQVDPRSASAQVAASYVRQAVGDLDGALRFSQSAAELAPNDAYAIARLAEMQMVIGDRRSALATANRALGIQRVPLALFVAGLAELAASHYEIAEALFNEAITIDSEAPLPRLGLGLTYIRRGNIAAGTWEIERAVILDPRRAALRTWLARGYFDEEMSDKAAEELRLAKIEDPDDPTPYLFSALQLYSQNRPILALRELQEAEKRGSARRTLRSARGLAEDSATRGAAEGRIYDVLGFDQLAINAGALAAEADPSNPGAHRFLADAYRQRPGNEMAQTSELLRSRLLSPPSKTPVQPQLAEADLALLDTSGPSRVTFAEFAPLFDADGIRLDASGLVGTQRTLGDEIAFTALYRTASFSVGQFHYETDGFRPNNDLRHDIFNAVGTVALTPEFSLFGEYRYRDTEAGDRLIDFYDDTFDPRLRSTLRREVARVGFHAQPTVRSDLIGVYTQAALTAHDESDLFFPGDPDRRDLDQVANGGQLQHIWQGGNVRNVSGGYYLHDDVERSSSFLMGLVQTFDSYWTESFGAYDYLYLDHPAGLSLVVGAALSSYQTFDTGPDTSSFDVFKFLPKIGVTAKLSDRITFRAAYFRNLKPELVSEQMLEPSSIAGFNQFVDAFNTSLLEQAGAGIDIDVTDRLTLGGEGIARWWRVPIEGAEDVLSDETVARGYVYATLGDDFAFTAELIDERSSSNAIFSDFSDWRTTSLPLTLSYFNEFGVFGNVSLEFVDHEFEGFGRTGTDDFHVVNAGIGYRLPDERGVISLEVQNLLDTDFNYQNRTRRRDIGAAPRYAPERTVMARATFRF